jgi:hypothetical protein
VHVSFVGGAHGLDFLAGAAEQARVRARVERYERELSAYERPAMQLIEAWSRSSAAGGSILYFTPRASALSSTRQREVGVK